MNASTSNHTKTYSNNHYTDKPFKQARIETEQLRKSVIYDTTKKDHHFDSNYTSQIHSPRLGNIINFTSKTSDELEVTQMNSFHSAVKEGENNQKNKPRKLGSPFKKGEIKSGSAIGSGASAMQNGGESPGMDSQFANHSMLSLQEQFSSQILKKTKIHRRNHRY